MRSKIVLSYTPCCKWVYWHEGVPVVSLHLAAASMFFISETVRAGILYEKVDLFEHLDFYIT
jgi:hypothetical protein